MDKIIKNNKGLTLLDTLLAVLVIGIIGASGLLIYKNFIPTMETGALTKNISTLRGMCEQYAKMNGFSYSGISAQQLQSEKILPSSWTLSGGGDINDIFPPGHSLVGYWIGSSVEVQGAFVIGIDSQNNAVTNQMALNLCDNFINQLAGFIYNNTAYTVTSADSCRAIIPANNFPIPSGQFFLGFE